MQLKEEPWGTPSSRTSFEERESLMFDPSIKFAFDSHVLHLYK